MAIARRLAESGYAVTISGRRDPAESGRRLADDDLKIEAVVADVTSEEAGGRPGRRNTSASTPASTAWSTMPGSGRPADPRDPDQTPRFQVAVNLRALAVATRESVEMLKKAMNTARR